MEHYTRSRWHRLGVVLALVVIVGVATLASADLYAAGARPGVWIRGALQIASLGLVCYGLVWLLSRIVGYIRGE